MPEPLPLPRGRWPGLSCPRILLRFRLRTGGTSPPARGRLCPRPRLSPPATPGAARLRGSVRLSMDSVNRGDRTQRQNWPRNTETVPCLGSDKRARASPSPKFLRFAVRGPRPPVFGRVGGAAGTSRARVLGARALRASVSPERGVGAAQWVALRPPDPAPAGTPGAPVAWVRGVRGSALPRRAGSRAATAPQPVTRGRTWPRSLGAGGSAAMREDSSAHVHATPKRVPAPAEWAAQCRWTPGKGDQRPEMNGENAPRGSEPPAGAHSGRLHAVDPRGRPAAERPSAPTTRRGRARGRQRRRRTRLWRPI